MNQCSKGMTSGEAANEIAKLERLKSLIGILEVNNKRIPSGLK